MPAKPFTSAPAVILLLVVSHSIGAHLAGAHPGPQLVDMDGGSPLVAIDSSKRLIEIYDTSVSVRTTCPGSGKPVTVLSAGDVFVAMDSGEVWRWVDEPCGIGEVCHHRELYAHTFGGVPLQVRGKSMSDVKGVYRK
jgi:hypothetical protein